GCRSAKGDYGQAARYFRLAASKRDVYAAHALRWVLYLRNPVLRHLRKAVFVVGYVLVIAHALTTKASFAVVPFFVTLLLVMSVAVGVGLIAVLLPWKTLHREVEEMRSHETAPRARDLLEYIGV